MNFIQNINKLSQSIFYQFLFLIFAISFSSTSFILQTINEPKCESFLGNFIRLFHHILLPFLYFGFLIPWTPIFQKIIWLIFIGALFNWLSNNNFCALTQWENYFCNLRKDQHFRDITYYWFPQVDDFIVNYRIKVLILYILIIMVRTM